MRNQQLNFRGGSVLIIVNSSRRQEQACIFPSTHVTILCNGPSAVNNRFWQAANLLRITLCLEGSSVTMKPILFCFSLAAVAWGVSAVIADPGTEKPASNPRQNAPAKSGKVKPNGPAADKKPNAETVVFPAAEAIVGERSAEDLLAIQKLVQAFAQGFNSHQSSAIAELFTEDAEITDESGRTLRGRPAIEKLYGGLFELQPETRMQVQVSSIRFLGKVLATEEGTTTIVVDANPESPVEQSRYSATYVKQDANWKIASARDLPSLPLTPAEHLQGLDWLIGTWVDENSDSIVQTTFRWSDDKHFLLSDFTVRIGNGPPLKGTQRIGWDPRTSELRSWTFDSAGGFGEAVWTRNGNRWISKTSGVSRQGQTATATNILTQISKDQATFQSRDRVVGGVIAPDIAEIPVVRKPPPPSAP